MNSARDQDRIRSVYERGAARDDGPATDGMARKLALGLGRFTEGRVLEIGSGTGNPAIR